MEKPYMELDNYAQYRETKIHEIPGFAYNTYLCTIPLDFKRVALHWHDQMEIIYIKKGSGIVSLNLQPLKVSAGCIVPVLPGEIHGIEGDPGVRMEYENIIFSLSQLNSAEENDWCRANILAPLMNSSLSFSRPIHPGTEFHEAVSSALDRADKICERRSDGYYLLVKSCLFELLYALYTFRTADPIPHDIKHTENLKSLLSWVKQHYQEPITIEDAASYAGYSPAHFMRRFKEETGQTFIHFLNDYRLSSASYRLAETDASISEIADASGFNNFSYFIRLFRQKFGTTPGGYRKSRSH